MSGHVTGMVCYFSGLWQALALPRQDILGKGTVPLGGKDLVNNISWHTSCFAVAGLSTAMQLPSAATTVSTTLEV